MAVINEELKHAIEGLERKEVTPKEAGSQIYLLTTEAIVAEKPEKKAPMPAMPPGGGMGGMGGMPGMM